MVPGGGAGGGGGWRGPPARDRPPGCRAGAGDARERPEPRHPRGRGLRQAEWTRGWYGGAREGVMRVLGRGRGGEDWQRSPIWGPRKAM